MKEISPAEQLRLTTLVILALGVIFIANGALCFFLPALQPFGLDRYSDLAAGSCLLASSFWIHKKSLVALAVALGIFWLQFALYAGAQLRVARVGMSFLLNAAFVVSVTLLLWPSFKAMRASRRE